MIEFKKMPKNNLGRYGSYVVIESGAGLKIFFKQGLKIEELWKDEGSIPYDWNEVLKEATILNKVQKSELVPKFMGLEIVKIRNKYYPAIKMEHIQGRHLLESEYRSFKISKNGIVQKVEISQSAPYYGQIRAYIDSKFRKMKFSHSDLHCNNVIITTDNKVKVIDFSSSFCCFINTKQEISSKLYDSYRKDLEFLLKDYKETIKDRDIALYHQSKIKNLANQYWENVFNLNCKDNKVIFSVRKYNIKRKDQIVNFFLKECSKLVKKKLSIKEISNYECDLSTYSINLKT